MKNLHYTLKYSIAREGREIQESAHYQVTIWKSFQQRLLFQEASNAFSRNINFVLAPVKILFADRQLAIQFPNHFRWAMDGQAKVKSQLERVGSQALWGGLFRRNHLEFEEFQLLALLDLLGKVRILEEGVDGRSWTCSFDGSNYLKKGATGCNKKSHTINWTFNARRHTVKTVHCPLIPQDPPNSQKRVSKEASL